MVGRPKPSTWPVWSVIAMPRYGSLSTPTQLTVTHGSAAAPVAVTSGLPTANRVMIASNSAWLNGPGLQPSTE